uniref:Uncharacterized protein n=1 Tax=Schimmelmannia schousboei TaxID=173468 RepID=A0A1C9C8V3_9FLOR|nr:hypothetical protein Schim_124 [Schimmelmannia schousboei]AOM64805.1 hypothetical protein Schim_124 [Schimmelmannia schousboei]
MEIINLTSHHVNLQQAPKSFAIKLNYLKEIWIFNCNEGCQHYLIEKQIKINQISKIILTELTINHISGLLGLLSSLSLINRKKPLHIYSPCKLDNYLHLGKKYSHTNFCYRLYFHILHTNLTINHSNYQLYVFSKYWQFDFIIITTEQYGQFKLNIAKKFHLKEGPLYGKLKKGFSFILPDGFILEGINFTNKNHAGYKISYISNKYHSRKFTEIGVKAQVL